MKTPPDLFLSSGSGVRGLGKLENVSPAGYPVDHGPLVLAHFGKLLVFHVGRRFPQRIPLQRRSNVDVQLRPGITPPDHQALSLQLDDPSAEMDPMTLL